MPSGQLEEDRRLSGKNNMDNREIGGGKREMVNIKQC